MSISGLVSETYITKWGKPSRKAKWDTQPPVEVWKWDERATPEGVAMYWTLGGSDSPETLGHQLHRAEFFMGFSPQIDEAAALLAELAHSPISTGEPLGDGHVVRIDRSWPGTAMSALLVFRPRILILEDVHGPEGVHIEFFQVIPLYESERSFVLTNGYSVMLDRWRASAVPFWDPARPASM